MRRLTIAAFALTLAASVLGQGASGNEPITVGEVSQVMVRARAVVSRVLFRKQPKPEAPIKSNTLATRAQIIRELHKLFVAIKPEFRFMPRKLPVDPSGWTLPAAAPERAMLKTLAEWGFVDRMGPLATNSGSSISLVDFGDAIGRFFAQTAYLTHTPSSEYTPALMGG